MRGAAALQIWVISASNCISQPEQLHWIFFPSFYLNKVIIFTFVLKELQLHTIKCRIAKLNPNKQQQEYPASFPKCSLTLRKMNKVLILPLFRYVVNWFHFFLFPALLFLFQWGWVERTQILIHCQRVLVIVWLYRTISGWRVLSCCYVTITYCNRRICANLITHCTSFCVMNSQIPFHPLK